MTGQQRIRSVVFLISALLLTDFFCFSVAYTADLISPAPYYRSTVLTGFTRPKHVINVSSEVSGKCLAIYAEVGEAVPSPGILAEIDDTYIRLDIDANRLELERVKRQLVTEKKMLKRYTTLREKNSATEAKLDEVLLSADLHELSIQNLNNQHRRLLETRARHKITVPEGWLLIERMIEPGEYVQSGQPVAKLGDFRNLIIPFALSFHELNALKKVDRIPLFLPDINIQAEAKIYRISPSYAEKTKKIPVELIIDSKQPDLEESIRGGLRAEMKLRLKESKNTYVVPLSAIINRYDAYWVLGEDQKRVKVIYLGTTDDGLSALISAAGLSETDKILREIPSDF